MGSGALAFLPHVGVRRAVKFTHVLTEQPEILPRSLPSMLTCARSITGSVATVAELAGVSNLALGCWFLASEAMSDVFSNA